MGANNSEILLQDATGNDIGISGYDTGVNDTTLKMTALNKDGTAAGAVADTHTTTFTDTTSAITSSSSPGSAVSPEPPGRSRASPARGASSPTR